LSTAYGVPHRIVAPADLATALEEPVTGIRVLEVSLDRSGRRSLAARIDDAVRAAVGP
jgi:2-succinyl-5-enolpyruvyl-6-hydroxy-3-cyclohexene-1-carboxylate synthase